MDDLDALVESCVQDGYGFGKITKEIRNEWKEVCVTDAISLCDAALESIQRRHNGTALATNARRVCEEWAYHKYVSSIQYKIYESSREANKHGH